MYYYTHVHNKKYLIKSQLLVFFPCFVLLATPMGGGMGFMDTLLLFKFYADLNY